MSSDRAGRSLGPTVPVPLERLAVLEAALAARHGDDVPLGLRDIEAEQVDITGAGTFDVLRPADWDLLVRGETDLPTWAALWPSAILLANTLAGAGRERLEGRRVLELGAGLALPSTVAAALGADVLATDGDPDAVCFAAANAPRAVQLTLDEAAAAGAFDLVIAADVLHDPSNCTPLLRALDGLATETWITDPGRPAADVLRARVEPERHQGGLLFCLNAR